jgi:hypothetical protein
MRRPEIETFGGLLMADRLPDRVLTKLLTFSLTREFVGRLSAHNCPLRALGGAHGRGAETPPPPQGSLREPPSTVGVMAIQVGGCPRWSVPLPLDPPAASRRWALRDRRGLVAPLR